MKSTCWKFSPPEDPPIEAESNTRAIVIVHIMWEIEKKTMWSHCWFFLFSIRWNKFFLNKSNKSCSDSLSDRSGSKLENASVNKFIYFFFIMKLFEIFISYSCKILDYGSNFQSLKFKKKTKNKKQESNKLCITVR